MSDYAGSNPLRSPKHVRAQWAEQPLAGPGTALWASGLVQLDCDGPGALAEAARRGLPAPLLIVQTTRPEGGWHVYWRRQPGVLITAAAEVLPDGSRIEVDAQGLAPLPPTLRPGGPWLQWLGAALGEEDPPPIPQWAADLLRGARERKGPPPAQEAAPRPPERPRRALSARMEVLLAAGPDGRYPTRSEALWALGCSMARAGWPIEEAEATLGETPWVAATLAERDAGWLRTDLERAYRAAWPQRRTRGAGLWG